VVEFLDSLLAEAIFGGLVLLFLLFLLSTGKIRFEREVKEKDKVIAYKDMTIQEQIKTIDTLSVQAEIANRLLQELRDIAQLNYDIERNHE